MRSLHSGSSCASPWAAVDGRQGGGRWLGERRSEASSSGSGGPRTGSHRFNRLDDLSAYPDLPSLAEAVAAAAQSWADGCNISTLRAAFNLACKLGMQPDRPPDEDDPRLQELRREVLRTLADEYLPLVLRERLRDAKDCIIPLWACAKAGYWDGGLAAALLERLVDGGGELLQQATGQGHGLLWWSLSLAPAELLAAPAAVEALRVSERWLLAPALVQLTPQGCSNILLAAARLQCGSEALYRRLTARLAELAPDTNCQDLGNSFYALGKLADECGHMPREEDLQRLEGEVVQRLAAARDADAAGQVLPARTAFKPQGLSNMLWGCAKLARADSALVRPLAEAVGRKAGRCSAQHLSNSLYAMAVLGCSGPSYTEAQRSLAEAAVRLLKRAPSEFNEQDLSNMLWALATLQPSDGSHSQALVDAALAEWHRRGVAGCTPQDLSNTAWALAKLPRSAGPHPHPEPYQRWFKAAVQAAMQSSFTGCATPQTWSNLLYALGLARHRPPHALLTRMAANQQLRTRANGQACANGLWSLAILYGRLELLDGASRAAVEALVERLAGRLGQLLRGGAAGEQLVEQALCNSLWALAVMGPGALARQRTLVGALLGEVARRWEAGLKGEFTVEGLTQLWHVQLELAEGGDGLAGAPSTGSGPLGYAALQKALNDFVVKELQQDVVAATDAEREVLQALEALRQSGQRPQHPQRTAGDSRQPTTVISVWHKEWLPQLGRRVDAAVELEGGRLLSVQFHGPNRFLANGEHRRTRNGPTQLRDRQLERMFGRGNVLNVPYWEWIQLKGDRAAQQAYLLRLMQAQLKDLL
ncbi:hypothetical protein GPECTOR_54g214 [Gonium pectorale]|uniref:RAP domain-containing protein n=1 Tax=Gonium pectorale TaxID=33097 RepID=A0A150G6S4_GONPE|nr:hypothetical protein GPECTOR_54g214 [Gonium pectorale]|eukprot:KXZ45473.1 hypothetical protein GPECTOR_54g214 [Gonium pectorale]